MSLIDRLQTEADLCRNDGADDIARLLDDAVSYISETVNERDAALALLREAQEVLSRNWFTDSDGESYNNDAVIAMDDKITKFLEPK